MPVLPNNQRNTYTWDTDLQKPMVTLMTYVAIGGMIYAALGPQICRMQNERNMQKLGVQNNTHFSETKDK